MLTEQTIQRAKAQLAFSERKRYREPGISKTKHEDFCALIPHENGKGVSAEDFAEVCCQIRTAFQRLTSLSDLWETLLGRKDCQAEKQIWVEFDDVKILVQIDLLFERSLGHDDPRDPRQSFDVYGGFSPRFLFVEGRLHIAIPVIYCYTDSQWADKALDNRAIQRLGGRKMLYHFGSQMYPIKFQRRTGKSLQDQQFFPEGAKTTANVFDWTIEKAGDALAGRRLDPASPAIQYRNFGNEDERYGALSLCKLMLNNDDARVARSRREYQRTPKQRIESATAIVKTFLSGMRLLGKTASGYEGCPANDNPPKPKDCKECHRIDRIVLDRVSRLQACWPLVKDAGIFISALVALCKKYRIELMLIDDTATKEENTSLFHSRWESMAQNIIRLRRVPFHGTETTTIELCSVGGSRSVVQKRPYELGKDMEVRDTFRGHTFPLRLRENCSTVKMF